MKCPVCRNELFSVRCQCGYKLTESEQAMVDLKQELTGMQNVLKAFSVRLDSLNRIAELMMEKNAAEKQQKDNVAGIITESQSSVKNREEKAGSSSAGKSQQMYIHVKSSETPEKPELKPVESVHVNQNPAVPEQKIPSTAGTDDVKKADRSRPKDGSLESAIGQKFFLICGVILIIFGIGYFLKYSFEHDLIPPPVRVLMSFIFSCALLWGGQLFRKKGYSIFGSNLSGGGIAGLYFTFFAAFQIYELISQIPAFLLMVGVTALACLLAVIYDTMGLAVLGTFGGFLTPLMLSQNKDSQIALMSYILLLNIGILFVSFHKKWKTLEYLGFIFTYIVQLGWHAEYFSKEKFWPALIFSTLFFLVYSIVPLARNLIERTRSSPTMFLMFLNTVFSFGFIHADISDTFGRDYTAAATVFFAFYFVVMAQYLYKNCKTDRAVFELFIIKAAFFIALTIPILFTKFWITIFWALLGAAYMRIGISLNKKSVVGGGIILLLFSGFRYIFIDPYNFRFSINRWAFKEEYTDNLHYRIVYYIVLALTYYAALKFMEKNPGKSFFASASALFSTMLGIVIFSALNVETGSFFNAYLPAAFRAAISILWSISSIVMVLLGFRYSFYQLRYCGIVLFFITIGKVFFVDMAGFSTPYRILSTIFLGIFLVITSFIYHKLKREQEKES